MTDVDTDDPEFPERAPLLKEANPDPEQPSTSSQRCDEWKKIVQYSFTYTEKNQSMNSTLPETLTLF